MSLNLEFCFEHSEELDVVLRNIDVLQPYLKENRLHLTYVTRKEPPSLLLKDESFWTLIEGTSLLFPCLHRIDPLHPHHLHRRHDRYRRACSDDGTRHDSLP